MLKNEFSGILRDHDVAADYIPVHASTLRRWRDRGEGPPFFKLGPRSIVYREADVVAWLASRRRNAEAQPHP